MNLTTPTLFVALALNLSGCSHAPPDAGEAHPLDALVNRVWMVRESSTVATGTLYVFLEEGTLVITSNYSEPLLGQWRLADNRLILTEQGIDYATDVVSLAPCHLRLRVHNPGDPVTMNLTCAANVRVH